MDRQVAGISEGRWSTRDEMDKVSYQRDLDGFSETLIEKIRESYPDALVRAGFTQVAYEEVWTG